jgi:hypothetical protein
MFADCNVKKPVLERFVATELALQEAFAINSYSHELTMTLLLLWSACSVSLHGPLDLVCRVLRIFGYCKKLLGDLKVVNVR